MYSNKFANNKRYDCRLDQMKLFAIGIILLLVITQNVFASYDSLEDPDFQSGSEGHGTLHEQAGQPHFAQTYYTDYISKARYEVDPYFAPMGLTPVYGFANYILDSFFRFNGSDLPEHYVINRGHGFIALGRNVRRNEWVNLISKNKMLMLLWIVPLLVLIIIMPFIGVCYFCFCCCRCRNACAPCDASPRRRLCCSILLIFLLIGIMLGTIVTFLANKQINRGFHDAGDRFRRGGHDVCVFLRDTADHVHHILSTNFQQFQDHALELASGAYQHIFLDLTDSSEGNAAAELERILDNFPKALKQMRQFREDEEMFRFMLSQLRDGLRGTKRNLIYIASAYCRTETCHEYVQKEPIRNMDTSKCLHIDKLPNTTQFIEAIENAIRLNLHEIPKKAIDRFRVIGEGIKEMLDPIVPILSEKLDLAGFDFYDEIEKIVKVINKVISTEYEKSVHSAKVIDEFYEFYGAGRNYINILISLILLTIVILCILAIIFGLCLRTHNTGYYLMIIVIIIIFCSISVLILCGLFYFIIGLLLHHGACSKSLNLSFDPYIPTESQHMDPMNLANVCRENETIFDLLIARNYYDPNRILKIQPGDSGYSDILRWKEYKGDLTKIVLITEAEGRLLNNTLKPLAPFKSQLYTKALCNKFSPMIISEFAYDIHNSPMRRAYGDSYWGHPNSRGHILSMIRANYAVRDLYALSELVKPVEDLYSLIIEEVRAVDDNLVANNMNFGETFMELMRSIRNAELYIRSRGGSFINTIGQNFTDTIISELANFKQRAYNELTQKVGHCKPLKFIYKGDILYVCHQIVNPINAFWLGTLFCAWLLIPLLFVAHRLRCLYIVGKHETTTIAYLVPAHMCPTCTGIPYVAPPVIVCSGGQQTYSSCPCNANRRQSESTKNK